MTSPVPPNVQREALGADQIPSLATPRTHRCSQTRGLCEKRVRSEPTEYADGREAETDDVDRPEHHADPQAQRLLGELVLYALLPVDRVLDHQQSTGILLAVDTAASLHRMASSRARTPNAVPRVTRRAILCHPSVRQAARRGPSLRITRVFGNVPRAAGEIGTPVLADAAFQSGNESDMKPDRVRLRASGGP